MNGHSVNSAMTIWLGFGMTYCGTSRTRSRTSAPPMITTATRTMTAISRCVRLPPSPNDAIRREARLVRRLLSC